ncbi:MAG: hypothetical protein KDD43_17220, partial [Bdellovibrionales bacterium]|nr:hypothetical protein [Bdellovibrionales bacterium]
IKSQPFTWTDLITKPTGEFYSRYFAGQGYKDGAHGLALAGLQAFSEFILHLKHWEASKFPEIDISKPQVEQTALQTIRDLSWWQAQLNATQPIKSFVWKLRRLL